MRKLCRGVSGCSLILWVLVGCGGGDGSEARSSEEPASEAEEEETTAEVCTGEQHSCVMKTTGEVYCWGRNLDGQLGDGSAMERGVPTPVVGITDAVEIACGHFHTCARHADGQLSCWGRSMHGQLGADHLTPTQVPLRVSGIDDAVEITAGREVSCARHAGGGVSCWGEGDAGQLGHGETESSATPVRVTGLADAVEIAAGRAHVCARRGNGRVVCWGTDRAGQLGRGRPQRHSASPVEVTGLTGAEAIDAAGNHSCALVGGGLRCWGSNGYGQLGDGEEQGHSAAPVAVRGLTGARGVFLGHARTCALLESGAVHCLGYNNFVAQRLGVGVREGRNVLTPTAVVGLEDVATMDAADQHACAIRRGGELLCWGSGGWLGDGEVRPAPEPRRIVADVDSLSGTPSVAPTFPPADASEAERVPHLASGSNHVCAVLDDGRVRCFGPNGDGQLGLGSTEAVPVGEERTAVGITDATQVSASGARTCVRRATGHVACWGNLGRFRRTSLPIPIDGVDDAVEVRVGGDMVCIRREGGGVSCFGQNNAGQLGDGGTEGSDTPVEVSGLDDATALAAANSTACAIREGGAVVCWGSGRNGALGSGEARTSRAPREVPGLRAVTALAAGSAHFCALHGGGRVSCWGANRRGQLGDGRSGADADAPAPRAIPSIRDASSIAAGHQTTCAVRRNGSALCWGASTFGQTGHGERGESITRPQRVATGRDEAVATFGRFVALTGGLNYMCGLHADGHVSCWGSTPLGGAGGFFGLANVRSPHPVPAEGLVLSVTEG